MLRIALALLALVVLADTASACGRVGVFGRLRNRIVHRERHVVRDRGTACAVPVAVVSPCPPVVVPPPKK